ncbi:MULTISPECIES: hypothetical protein [Enterobacteriaceae]|jgi:hypothetical protein|uniref:hypothetical protein n=1 Tax=Enterobacteriaceae TaxID=543 RepID=UPI001C715EE9|nr:MULTISPECIES: hypothetical protein [Enterobacteriaceae]MDM3278916.1 hypothetical protein [Citrobacter sp. Ce104]
MSSVLSNSAIISALVSAIVTLLIFLLKAIISYFRERSFHEYKIRIENEYEQRKKIKEAISKYKTPLLDSAESLNHRLWNFSKNCNEAWHIPHGDNNINNMYYLQSFCFRLLSFLAWCKIFERELIYLDSTLSVKDDLDFVKYIRTMQNIFSDASIFNGLDYDPTYAVDHFFKDHLSSMVDFMINDKSVISFSEFMKCDTEKYIAISNYISSITKERHCNKWYLLNNFHFVLMAFLSRYGYDFQITDRAKLIKFKMSQPENILSGNLNEIIIRGKLHKCKKMKEAIEVLLSD